LIFVPVRILIRTYVLIISRETPFVNPESQIRSVRRSPSPHNEGGEHPPQRPYSILFSFILFSFTLLSSILLYWYQSSRVVPVAASGAAGSRFILFSFLLFSSPLFSSIGSPGCAGCRRSGRCLLCAVSPGNTKSGQIPQQGFLLNSLITQNSGQWPLPLPNDFSI